jgi:hypothetical protein
MQKPGFSNHELEFLRRAFELDEIITFDDLTPGF